jgi:hypothetical protein
LDEFYFDSYDEALKRWPDEVWAAKGKPRLWVKMYDREGIMVWRDVAYGLIRLKTSEGTDEGPDTVTVNNVTAILRKGKLEVNLSKAEADEVFQVDYLSRTEQISPEEDTVRIDVRIAVDENKPRPAAERAVTDNLRKVVLTRVQSVGAGHGGRVTGWEYAPPKRYERYAVKLTNETVFKTSSVLEIEEEQGVLLIKTANSSYEIKYM